MEEVFKRIIEKLNTERNPIYRKDGSVMGEKRYIEIDRAIEIVKQIASEYNNGWILCSKRLPEEYTVLCCDTYGEMIIGHPYFDEMSDTGYSADFGNEIMYNCIKWHPLPDLCQAVGIKITTKWYDRIGNSIEMKLYEDADKPYYKWVKGKIIKGYRYQDGVITMESDDGRTIWCGVESSDYRKADDSLGDIMES